MSSILQKAAEFWQGVSGLLRFRRDREPIAGVAALQEFVATRAAFVAQKTLYGYVKTRMGIRYPAMFADDKVIASLNIAKLHVFAACLSDLTIFAVGVALDRQPLGNDARIALARLAYAAAIDGNTGDAPEQFSAPDAIAAFEQRLQGVDWRVGALRLENFTDSPKALHRWAPIADELKKFDAEIVENSIKYAWRDIREQFRKRVDPAGVYADWIDQAGT